MADMPKSSPILRFNPALPKKDLEKIRDNVSAIVLDGNHLWLGGDEGTSIHRMTRDASGDFGDHTSFELKETAETARRREGGDRHRRPGCRRRLPVVDRVA